MIDAELEEFYSTRCDESLRLTSSVKGRLEQARVQDLLTRYLPPAPARVADIGGGTGVHAEWLRSEGYRVELLDPIRRHVETARAAGIKARLGDARDLPWRDDRFDAALLAGPIYHLVAAGDRKAALYEVAQVVKPGGAVAVLAFNRHANLLGATLANQLIQRCEVVEDIEAAGSTARHDRVAGSTYYHAPGELVDELASAGLNNVIVHGLTGPGGWLGIVIDAYFPDSSAWPLALVAQDPLETALTGARMADRYPELVVASTLLLAVGTVAP